MNKLKLFVEGKEFKNFILGVIIFNSLLLGLMTVKNMNETFNKILNYIDLTCLVIYIIEMLLKLIVYNVIGYFKSLWNCFDFIIIVFSILSEFTSVSSIKVMRSLRIFRSLRSLRGFKLISSVDSIQVIISAIGKSLPGVGWTGILIFIIFYLFAIIGVSEFGDEFQDWFGTIPKAMYTLFQVMTFESWSMGISRPVMKMYPYAWIYFIPFLILSAFVAMNVIIGIVVNSVSNVCEDNKNEDNEKSNQDNIISELNIIREHLNNIDELLKKGKFVGFEEYDKNLSIKVNKIDKI